MHCLISIISEMYYYITSYFIALLKLQKMRIFVGAQTPIRIWETKVIFSLIFLLEHFKTVIICYLANPLLEHNIEIEIIRCVYVV